ncbi:MAG: PHP domain-containing protein [Tissierellia bacterium]|nr:PHP domain-containing protein [Tissierellia bacterium]
MKILTDFHTHTIYSRRNHAKGTIRENIESAISKGLKELWITDHGPGHFGYGILRENFPKVRKEIDELNKEYEGRIKIYFGVEANVMDYDGKIDVREEEKQYLDGINVGFHYGIVPRGIKAFTYFLIINPLSKILPFMRNWIKEKNTDALINIVNNHDIKIITHPSDKVRVNIERLAGVCETRGTALEINSSHKHMNEEDIKQALKTNVLISVGSDAHTPEDVGEFEVALKRIENTETPYERIINLKEV